MKKTEELKFTSCSYASENLLPSCLSTEKQKSQAPKVQGQVLMNFYTQHFIHSFKTHFLHAL